MNFFKKNIYKFELFTLIILIFLFINNLIILAALLDLKIVKNFPTSILQNIEIIFMKGLFLKYFVYKPAYWGMLIPALLSLIFIFVAIKGLKEDKEEKYSILHFTIIGLTPPFLALFIIYWLMVIQIASV